VAHEIWVVGWGPETVSAAESSTWVVVMPSHPPVVEMGVVQGVVLSGRYCQYFQD
jgi:hypothetical protein